MSGDAHTDSLVAILDGLWWLVFLVLFYPRSDDDDD